MDSVLVNDAEAVQSDSTPLKCEAIERAPVYLLSDVLVDVLAPREKRLVVLFVVAWLIATIGFFFWWCRAEHVIGPIRFALNTLLVTWTIVVPSYFLFFALRMKTVYPHVPFAVIAARGQPIGVDEIQSKLSRCSNH